MIRLSLHRQFPAILVLMLCCVAAPAGARTFDGVTMADRMVVDSQTLVLNGMGVRSFTLLHVHGYVAGLYVPQPTHDSQAILQAPGVKVVRIQFVRGAGIGRVQAEMQHRQAADCVDGCPKEDDAAFRQLFDTAREVHSGDTSTYIYGAAGLRVLFDDKPATTIANPDFARRMLDGMIGKNPSSAALRDGMLGVSSD